MTARQENNPRRVTIGDIAGRVGVSRVSVSYALNSRPGVAEETRARILEVAKEMGWYPNAAARALAGSSVSVCGLVLARPARTLAVEPFFMSLIAGMESVLSADSIGLTLQLVDSVESEITVLRRWWAERRVDGVFLVDLRVTDPRIALVRELRLPTVLVGSPSPDDELAGVLEEAATTMAEAVRYLSDLGHRRIARVGGHPVFRHTQRRSAAFTATVKALGIEGSIVDSDYMAEAGARVTRQLILSASPPSAIIYDNGILAVAGLGVAHELGLEVPGDLSIVAWDDSQYCEVVHPPLTAISHDTHAFGTQAATTLLRLLGGGPIAVEPSTPAVFIVRSSTGPPRPRSSRRRSRSK